MHLFVSHWIVVTVLFVNGVPAFAGSCVDDAPSLNRPCTLEHGTGIQYCDSDTGNWKGCWATSCDDGYVMVPNDVSCDQGGSCGGSNYYCRFDHLAASAPVNPPTSSATSTATQNSVSTAAEVAAATSGSATAKVKAEASTASVTQISAIKSSALARERAANYAATIGTLHCAEAAVVAETVPELSASDQRACEEYFKSANTMLNPAYKSTLGPDEAVMKHNGAKDIVAAFSEKFGIPEDEVVGKVMATRGSRTGMAALTGAELKSIGEDSARHSGKASGSPEKGAVPQNNGGENFSGSIVVKIGLPNKGAKPGPGAAKNEGELVAKPTRSLFSRADRFDLGPDDTEAVHELGKLINRDIASKNQPEEPQESTIFQQVSRRYRTILPRLFEGRSRN